MGSIVPRCAGRIDDFREFVDVNTGWALGTRGEILKTTTDGKAP
jgi:hypothetical protein